MNRHHGPLLVLCAMEKEAKPLRERLAGYNNVIIDVMGVGKVYAALTTQRAIAFHRPRRVILVGVAGGLNEDLKPMTAVIVEETAQWDFDLTAFGDPAGQLNDGKRFFTLDPEGVELASAAAEREGLVVHRGKVVSGDTFVADPVKSKWIRETFEADAIEMEGAAVAVAASESRIPLTAIRVLTDPAGSEAAGEYYDTVFEAADRAARIVANMFQHSLSQL